MEMLKRGIYTPLVTPFSEDEVDYQALLSNVNRLNSTSVHGYLILGSSSESVLLNREERLRIIEEVISHSGESGKMILVGVMEESTKSAVSFISAADKFNPDVYLILPPTYYKPSIKADTFVNFYRELSAVTEIPIFYYNVPIFSSVSINSKVLLNLIEKAWIKGWKDSSTELERFIEIQNGSGTDFQSFTGNASLLLKSLKNGAEGGILAISNALPELCSSIFTAYSEGNVEQAEKLQKELVNFDNTVMKPYGLAGLKYAMNQLGYSGGSVRQPYSDLDNDTKKRLRHFLDSEGFIP